MQEILDETNGGQLTIKGLKISMEDQKNSNDRAILLQFSNIKNLPSPISISYTIIGTDPSWVDKTDTQLAIKLQGIKRFSLDRLTRSFRSEGLVIFLLVYLTLYSIFSAPLPFIYLSPYYSLSALDGIAVLLVALLLIVYIGQYFFPSYNFCWGTYEVSFKRRKAIGIWLLSGVLAAVLVGIIANFISVHIGIH